jgi:hypothetical protein
MAVLGIIFLPFTTLFYVIMYTPGIGLRGWDWLWIFMAVLIDIGHWAHTGYTNRQAIRGTLAVKHQPRVAKLRLEVYTRPSELPHSRPNHREKRRWKCVFFSVERL